MIIYSATRGQFNNDVLSNQIEQRIIDAFASRAGRRAPKAEITAWRNSMQYMNNVLLQTDVPDDAGVAIEYGIPLTAKRVDFILTGQDAKARDVAVIVELKQWSEVEATDKDAVVKTFVGGGHREQPHPSYQAWTYAALIQDFNETVQEDNIQLAPCAYLHNCDDASALQSSFYADHLDRAPAFARADVVALRDFITRHIRRGDQNKLLYRIDHGRLKPSKSLIDHLSGLLRGNRVFQLIDDQKLVYETALDLVKQSRLGQKQVLIVAGGPGTGKSVVAVNLLVAATEKEWLAHYVTRNAAPREVFASRLTGTMKKTHIHNLFKSSGSYIDAPANGMDVLIVDEAHRLNAKSGLYQNLGESQIKELIEAARTTVFFIDEDQRVTLKDVGSQSEIRRWAKHCGAHITEMTLASQFRCNGSDGYLAWLDHTLQIRETANPTLDGIPYDFQVFDDPHALFAAIERHNQASGKARLVAGYCWPWKGKKDKTIRDIVFPEHDFAMRWNLSDDGPLWLIKPDSINEVGCIHTCQGLELDYVGVIIGPDLVVRDGQVVTDATQRASQDRSVHGFKGLLKSQPEKALAEADAIIKNTYRTLMTRGMKGCYLYCTDAETAAYFRQRISASLADEPLRQVAEPRAPYNLD